MTLNCSRPARRKTAAVPGATLNCSRPDMTLNCSRPWHDAKLPRSFGLRCSGSGLKEPVAPRPAFAPELLPPELA
eukprot:13816914-Alexandrium_andersonii.AAC.1